MKLFIIYAREDQAIKEVLVRHLYALKDEFEELEIWHDGLILSGSEWETDIKNRLNLTDIFLLIVSVDFLNSGFIRKVELKQALEKHHKKEAKVVPVIARYCQWNSNNDIKSLNLLPTGGTPIKSKIWDNEDYAYNNVTSGVRTLICDILKNRNNSSVSKSKNSPENKNILPANSGEMWGRKFDAFNAFIVQDSLAFVGRDEIKKGLYAMSEEKRSNVMVIEGDPQSGISFINYYFAEIAKKAKCFEFFYLNLKEDISFSPESGESVMVYAAHIAQYVLNCFDSSASLIDYTANVKNFKITSFIIRLREIDKLRPRKMLFYIDQFDVPLGPDVNDFLEGLSRDFKRYDINCSIVLGGFNKTNDWEFNVRQFANVINIGSGCFIKDHVIDFLKRVYTALASSYYLNETVDEFVAKHFVTIPEILFDSNQNPTNVTDIGEKLTSWYNNTYKQIQSQL